MSYKFYNANPLKNETSDCVIRALSVILNRSWREVYDELTYIAGNHGTLFDRVEFVEDYLDSRFKRQCHYSKQLENLHKNIHMADMLLL